MYLVKNARTLTVPHDIFNKSDGYNTSDTSSAIDNSSSMRSSSDNAKGKSSVDDINSSRISRSRSSGKNLLTNMSMRPQLTFKYVTGVEVHTPATNINRARYLKVWFQLSFFFFCIIFCILLFK